jgi:hypothetical protein
MTETSRISIPLDISADSERNTAISSIGIGKKKTRVSKVYQILYRR